MKHYKIVVERQQAYMADEFRAQCRFQLKVEKYLNSGWNLTGGVSIAIDRNETIIYSQALYKED